MMTSCPGELGAPPPLPRRPAPRATVSGLLDRLLLEPDDAPVGLLVGGRVIPCKGIVITYPDGSVAIC